MGHVPLRTSIEPSIPGVNLASATRPETSRKHQPDNSLIETLRRSVAERSHPAADIFRAAANSARILTGAEGIALAIEDKDSVTCCGRSGQLAPQIGSALDVTSGISGACFRSGKSLRCDDSQADDRVDAELCREMNLASILVVPIKHDENVVGILEAFSSRIHAFDNEDVHALEELAAIVASAARPESSQAPAPCPTTKPRDLIEARREQIRRELIAAAIPETRLSERPLRRRKERYWILVGVTIVILLIAAVIWISWHETDVEETQSQVKAQPHLAAERSAPHSERMVVDFKPSPVRAQINRGHSLGILRNAARTEKAAAPVAVPIAVEQPPTAVAVKAEPGLTVPADALPTSETLPPVVAAPPPANSPVAGLAFRTATLPNLDVAVSQGVSGGDLIHHIQPEYPAAARAQGIWGTVILQLTVTEEGYPRDIKILSGPPVLAEAAVAAVRQWRYSPSLLNGKPITVQKQVTTIFRLR